MRMVERVTATVCVYLAWAWVGKQKRNLQQQKEMESREENGGGFAAKQRRRRWSAWC